MNENSGQLCFTEVFSEEHKNAKRLKKNWEYSFQRWCDKEFENENTSTGKCGYSAICDYCVNQSGSKPCVTALNLLLKDKRKQLDYADRDFRKIWEIKE